MENHSQLIHVLNQDGVIVSFSISKKVTQDEIDKFIIKHKKKGKTNKEIQSLLQDKILNEIQTAIVKKEIPGLLSLNEVSKQMGLDKNIVKNLPELNNILNIVFNQLNDNNYDKMSLCYFINGLVNMLSLSEKDFQKYHKENKTETTSSQSNEDEDQEDSDEDEGDNEDDDGFHDSNYT